MTPMDYALTSVSRLHGMLLDRQCGKVVPDIMLHRELALLTQRIHGLSTEPVVFDLTAFRQAQEADEIPAAHGVSEEDDA